MIKPVAAETASSCTLDQWFSSDEQLHHVYPKAIQLLAARHWTPLNITQMVVKYLAPCKDVKILDIGSGRKLIKVLGKNVSRMSQDHLYIND